MPDDTEPSLVEYARYHGIATDHTAIDPYRSISLLSADNIEESIVDPNGSLSVDIEGAWPVVQEKVREKLHIDSSVARLLSEVLRPKPRSECRSDSHLPNFRLVQELKLELPLLPTDHEMDMRRLVPKEGLEDLYQELSLITLDDEGDEGLAFPSFYDDMVTEVREQAMHEKLASTRGALRYIEYIMEIKTDEGDIWEQGRKLSNELSYKKDINTVEGIQTPLISREPTPTPFVPPSPLMQMTLLSDPESPPIPEAEHVRMLLDRDGCMEPPMDANSREDEDSRVEKLLSLDANSPDPVDLYPIQKKGYSDMKTDNPITPPMSTKKAQGREDIMNNAMRQLPCFEIWTPNNETNIEESHQFLEPNIVESIDRAKDSVENNLAGESIRGVTTGIKCDVPDLSSSQGHHTWPPEGSQRHTGQLSPYLILMNISLQTFDGSIASPDPQLTWEPSSSKEATGFDEMMGDQSVAQQFLLDAEDALDDSKQTVLSPGYFQVNYGEFSSNDHLLSQDDEQPKPTNSRQGGQITSTDHIDTDETSKVPLATRKENGKRKRSMKRPKQRKKPHSHEYANNGSINSPGVIPQFSASKFISNFMEIRGRKQDIHQLPCALSIPSEEPRGEITSQNTDLPPENEENQMESIPVPYFPAPDHLIPLVISTSLLRTHKSLVRDLECMENKFVLLFRDYEFLKTMGTSPGTSIEEADIILSPKTGVLLTTFQATTQKYLPGHVPSSNDSLIGKANSSPLWSRIANACLRYEELYVFVCHNFLSGEQDASADQMTIAAINSLYSFCMSLREHATVMPIIVSPSSPARLTEWVVSFAHRAASSTPWSPDLQPTLSNVYMESMKETPSHGLSDSSTSWELFLGYLGLNPLAAQFVLHHGGTADMRQTHTEAGYFSRFILMTPEERGLIYGDVVGETVLRRVEGVLQMQW